MEISIPTALFIGYVAGVLSLAGALLYIERAFNRDLDNPR